MYAEVPLHPFLVHLPLGLAAVMPLLAFSLLGAMAKGWLPARAWSLAFGVQALLTIGAFMAVRSGESEKDRVEAQAPAAALHAHEEAGEALAQAAGVVLLLSLLPLLSRNERTGRIAGLLCAAGSVAVLALAVDAGKKGGALVYEHGVAAPEQPADIVPASFRREPDDAERGR